MQRLNVIYVLLSAIMLPLIIKQFVNGIFDQDLFLTSWYGIISSILIFELGLKLFDKRKKSRFVDFIANISFEIYLVHHVFAFGRFSVMNVTHSWCMGFALLILISIMLGYILHRISDIKIAKE